MILETRLTLRPFAESDLDDLSSLMANADFMRFSLGAFSREQTAAFLDRVRARFPTIVFGISRERGQSAAMVDGAG